MVRSGVGSKGEQVLVGVPRFWASGDRGAALLGTGSSGDRESLKGEGSDEFRCPESSVPLKSKWKDDQVAVRF